MKSEARRLALLWSLLVLCPSAVFAQASIAGAVKDTSGAVLPGVTVEASSPALIEKTRSVLTDGTGQYKIVDLRPGTYMVTFTLTGFNAFKRDGIELSGSFVATVNADLKVGAVEETVTVTGETPIVDIQSVKTQAVLTNDVLTALPTARNYESLHILVPGVTVAAGSQDVGGSTTNSLVFFTAHGSDPHDSNVLVNGLGIADVQSNGGRSMYVPSVGSTQEVSITTSGGLGEAQAAGVTVNMMYKDGGNRFAGMLFATGATEGMVSSNYGQTLKDAGLRAPNNTKNVFDFNGTLGGPIFRDRLWFFFEERYQGATNYVAGMFANKNAANPNAWTYDPDLSKQSLNDRYWLTESGRLTWQATPRNKFVAFYSDQLRCVGCDGAATPTSTPEANGRGASHPNNLGQFFWNSPLNSRVLLEAGYSMHWLRYGGEERPDIWNPSMISVSAQNGSIPGLTYRAPTSTAQPWIGNYYTKAALTYTSGAHSMKFGYDGAFHNFTQSSDSPQPVSYRFTTPDPGGVPNRLTQRIQPFTYLQQLNQWGLYAQDQWTVGRVTLGGGVRYDKFVAYFPETVFGPGRAGLVPNRIVVPAEETTNMNDITPRMSAAYDLFGNGKTAVKVALGKYVLAQNSNNNRPLGGQAAPMARITSQANRAWTDNGANGGIANDFIPQCDLNNPLANGECGALDDQKFGTANFSQRIDPAVAKGWGVRPYNWSFDLSVQHALLPQLAVTAGYYRRWYGNFNVIVNQAIPASGYQFFNLPLQSDPRLPISGTVNGFFDIDPSPTGACAPSPTGCFGLQDNVVTAASNYGNQIEHWNGFDVTMNARLRGVQVQGGVDTGRSSRDICEVAQKAPSVLLTANPVDGFGTAGQSIPMQYCQVDGAFRTQVKLLGSYTVPRFDVQVAATLQNLPGQEIVATQNAGNSVVNPLLGRNLAGGAANIALNLLPPLTYFSDRVNQLDFRVAKILRFSGKRAQVTFDLYNALNSDVVQTYNPTYSPTGSWRVPTAILPARLAKVSAQFDF